MDREAIKKVSRIVIKLGSSILTNDGTGLDQNFINSICHQVSQMQDLGKEIVIVSSGAIAEGMLRLGLNLNSRKIDQLQTAAALGQSRLSKKGILVCFQLGLQRLSVLSKEVSSLNVWIKTTVK